MHPIDSMETWTPAPIAFTDEALAWRIWGGVHWPGEPYGELIVVWICPSTRPGLYWVALVKEDVTYPLKRALSPEVVRLTLAEYHGLDLGAMRWRWTAAGCGMDGPMDGPELAETPGHVYFVQPIGGGLIKIGFAVNVATRLNGLQSMSPVKLVVLASTPGSYKKEKEMHRRFDALRSHGEWFHPGAELLAFIDEIKVRP